jgi:hypothetical protein
LYSPSENSNPAVDFSEKSATTIIADTTRAQMSPARSSVPDQISVFKSESSDAMCPSISTYIEVFMQRTQLIRKLLGSQPCIVCGGSQGARICCQHVDVSGAKCRTIMHVLCGLSKGFALHFDSRQVGRRMSVRCNVHDPANVAVQVPVPAQVPPQSKSKAVMSPLPIIRSTSSAEASDHRTDSWLLNLGHHDLGNDVATLQTGILHQVAATLNKPASIEAPDKYFRVRVPGVSDCILPTHELRPTCDALSIAALIEEVRPLFKLPS